MCGAGRGENKQKEKRQMPAAKRKTGKRGEEKQGKEIVSNYGGLFEGGGKYDTIGIWKEK